MSSLDHKAITAGLQLLNGDHLLTLVGIEIPCSSILPKRTSQSCFHSVHRVPAISPPPFPFLRVSSHHTRPPSASVISYPPPHSFTMGYQSSICYCCRRQLLPSPAHQWSPFDCPLYQVSLSFCFKASDLPVYSSSTQAARPVESS